MKTKTIKKRLDLLLVDRGLAESRQKAQAAILAGQVRVNGQRADKAGEQFAEDTPIEIAGPALRYASRGGLKLEGALADFGVNPNGQICFDVGCSTGGFTDCLLQHGAAHVYAMDVTTNQLAYQLRKDPRVTCIEGNARFLSAQAVPQRPTLIVIDLSFISVAKVLPPVAAASAPGATFLILVKPQFELGREAVGRGGIVRDPELHRRAVESVSAAAVVAGLEVLGVAPSHVTGAEGNQEFFIHAHLSASALNSGAPRQPVR